MRALYRKQIKDIFLIMLWSVWIAIPSLGSMEEQHSTEKLENSYSESQRVSARTYFTLLQWTGIENSILKRVLHIGCGSGLLTLSISAYLKNAHIVGIDICEKDIQRATKNMQNNKSLSFYMTTLEELKSDELFDGIMCFGNFECAVNRKNFLKQCYRLLKPGGLLIITPNQNLEERKKFSYTHPLQLIFENVKNTIKLPDSSSDLSKFLQEYYWLRKGDLYMLLQSNGFAKFQIQSIDKQLIFDNELQLRIWLISYLYRQSFYKLVPQKERYNYFEKIDSLAMNYIPYVGNYKIFPLSLHLVVAYKNR